MGGSDVGTAMSMCLMPLNFTLKNGTRCKFHVMCILQFKNIQINDNF